MSLESTRGANHYRPDRGSGEAGGRGRRQASSWVFPALLLAVALVAAHSIETLNDYVVARSESRVLLKAVEDDAAEQQIAEYEAILEGRVTPEIREKVAHERREVQESLSEFERLGPGDGVASRIREALGAFEAAVDEEFRLIEAGRLEEARVVDEERTDPGFEELNERMEAADEAYEGAARRTDLAADWGTYATTLLGSFVLAAAFRRYGRGLRSKQEALEQSEARFRHRALHDPLTGLPNRELFVDRLRQAFSRSERHEGCVAALFMDLDNFKHVNDSLGHEAGDDLLVAVAGRLRGCLRPEDTLARFGGDEFAVLVERAEFGAGGASVLAGRIAQALGPPFVVEGREVFVTASVGVRLCVPNAAPDGERAGDPAEALLRDADAAMYRAKRGGKARHEVFDPDSYPAEALQRLELENDLRRALSKPEEAFVVHYQPKVSLRAGEIVGFEALVRWEHPERGLVSPARFIPLAEETGLIVPIGRWVLQEACRRAREWHERYPVEPPLTMSVNLSARQFKDPALASDIAGILEGSGLEARYLTLEITETTVMEDVRSAVGTLWELKDMGVRTEVDDFGTGYSSLSYLKRFPVDYLKIDRSFVEGLGRDPEDGGIASAVVNLAHTLGLEAVAEGVETGEQLGLLREMGCDLAQGYYFWRPLPAEAAEELLATYHDR